jgi:hypothetical protein
LKIETTQFKDTIEINKIKEIFIHSISIDLQEFTKLLGNDPDAKLTILTNPTLDANLTPRQLQKINKCYQKVLKTYKHRFFDLELKRQNIGFVKRLILKGKRYLGHNWKVNER